MYTFFKQRDNSITRPNLCIIFSLIYFLLVGNCREQSGNLINAKKRDIWHIKVLIFAKGNNSHSKIAQVYPELQELLTVEYN